MPPNLPPNLPLNLPPDPPAIILPGPDTPIVDAAILYAQLELPPVPLYGLSSSGECLCGRGADCKSRGRGKHPIGEDWQKRATCDVDAVRDRFAHHRGNIGIALAPQHLVLIDADGAEALAEIQTWNLPPTLTQQSGRGPDGAHFVYRFAPHQDASLVTDRKLPGTKIDVKARGQFVAAPSLHVSGNRYTWTVALPPATLPDDVYARIRRAPALPPSPSPPPSSRDDPSSLYDRARKYIDAIPAAISGSGGHTQTFDAARAIAGWIAKGLPSSRGWDLLLEYNQRCEPPWSERELQHKFLEAAKASHIPAIADRQPPPSPDRPRLELVRSTPEGDVAIPAAPVNARPLATRVEPDWRSALLCEETRTGASRIVVHVDNVIRILQLAPEWRGKIRFDDFRSRIVVTDAPWDEYQRPNRDLVQWSDNDTTRLASWLRRHFHRYKFAPSFADCERAVAVVARTHDFNPVRDYLGGLEWDGVPRLASWLTTYLGTPADEYARLVGAGWRDAAVARVYDPGCKVDTVPVLEGPQGLRKSTALKVLAGAEFFNDTPIDLNSKDAYSAIQGCWFVELAELESLMRVDPSRSKAFFSSGVDRFRRAYARHETEERRQCIFVGTVNLGEYLSDPTGARRFWPIPCSRIDLAALERDRDQLWAEAVAEHQSGRVWYPETEADDELFAPKQAGRTKGDAWEKKIRMYLDQAGAKSVTCGDVLLHALDVEPKDWTPAAQTRVGIIMISRLRWEKRRVTVRSGDREYVYERPADTSARSNDAPAAYPSN